MPIKKIAVLFLAFIFLLEIGLRVFLGFCDDVLMMENDKFEYIAQPSQKHKRFGNNIVYNSYSMRSDKVNRNAKKVLGFGDSILNGGSMTEHDSLATSHLNRSLTTLYNHEIQVLNISAGSWGPDNCFAYLKEFGDFDADIILLVVSSHDAYDTMDFKKVVNYENGYRSEQYKLAIIELFDRYIFPNKFDRSKSPSRSFNPGFELFRTYCIENKTPLIVYLHAELEERNNQSYHSMGEEIIAFCENNEIELIQELNYPMDKSNYRDNIHLSEKGQRKMADIILKYFVERPWPTDQ